MGSDIGYALASMLNPEIDWRMGRSTDDEMSRGIWEETESRK